jgi:hypothetical protein
MSDCIESFEKSILCTIFSSTSAGGIRKYPDNSIFIQIYILLKEIDIDHSRYIACRG